MKIINNKGFTLIEALVYIFILAIASTVIIIGILKLVETYNITRFEREVLVNSRSGLDNILSELVFASSVYIPTSSGAQISLQTSLNPPSDEIRTYTDFYLDNNRLYLKKEGQEAQALTSEKVQVTDLNFTYLDSVSDPSSVKVSITVKYVSEKPRYQREITLFSSVALRGRY